MAAAATPISDTKVVELLCHLVAQATEHAFILLDPDGRILWCNSGAERLLDATSDSIVGRNVHEIFTDEDRASGIDRLELSIASSNAISEDDRWHVRADGSTFWASGALLPLRQPGSGALLGFGKIMRDRTDVKTQLELLRNQYDNLQSSDEGKSRAITKLSHELRNVIAGIRGTVEMLDQPLDNEARRRKFSQLMLRQVAMIERLTEDLLEAKRGQEGKIDLALEPVVLQRELSELLESLGSRLEERRLQLQLLAPPADIIVNADRQRLQQIFGNLIDNAIKYTPVAGRIWVKVTTEDRAAVVHIEDTGRGIPHDMLQRIFELFTQVDTEHSGRGLGVGLALVRELVVLHGGSVNAISKGLGEGSEFTVRLPLAEIKTVEAEAATKTAT
jgi:two-component system CheB/CheR fusion protein